MGLFSTTSIHDVSHIRAYSTRSMGAPLTLELCDKDGRRGTFIIFVGNQKLADGLVEAINKVCREQAAHIADVYELEPEGAA